MLEINVIGNLRHTYISIIIALIVLNKHINSEEKTPAILRVTIAVIPKGHKFKVDSPDFQNCRQIPPITTNSVNIVRSPLVGQLTHIILHFVVQAPNLARMLLSMYLFKKAR